jgi:ATP-dependent NAD(P)H-hydrate dehydratase
MELFQSKSDQEDYGKLEIDSEVSKWVSQVSKKHNAIVLKKGIIDIVSDGTQSYYISTKSSLKRCGGQGDILSGILGTFISFSDNLTSLSPDHSNRLLLSVVAASVLTRKASLRAYDKKRLSLTTPDIIIDLADIVAELSSSVADATSTAYESQ